MTKHAFPAPAALRGDQLVAELAAAGLGACDVHVTLADGTGDPILVVATAGDLDRDAVAPVVAAHSPTVPVEHTNRVTLHDRAIQALAVNATFTGKATPTNAENAAQIKALTRQSSAVIRLLLGRLDATD